VDALDQIFKAYDIRGRVDTGELTEEVARSVGIGFAGIIDESTVAVGRDCRTSSPRLAAAFIDGLLAAGKDVLDVGEVSTDVIYFVAGARGTAGAMITASHNPPSYNGIKLCRSGAVPVGEESGLADIKAIVRAGAPTLGTPSGSVSAEDVRAAYADHLFSIVDPGAIEPLTVALDGGNGMAGAVLPQILERLPLTTLDLYLEPDGTFPNHPANPIDPANLVEVQALVTDGGADLGVAFDGDADRAFFIDDRGVPLSGSTTTALIARWFLGRHPGASIVHNLITSKAVPEVISAAGGTPVRTRVGHSFIKAVMAETDAVFGGEHSGHYYFRDNFRADSGLLAMLVLLQVLGEDGRPLSELRRDVEPYAHSGEINLDVVDKEAAMERAVANFPDATIDRLDGVTIDLGDRWCNLRPSNTEPVLRLNVEAADQFGVDTLVAEVRGVVGVGV
jgi:phosphomannomutase